MTTHSPTAKQSWSLRRGQAVAGRLLPLQSPLLLALALGILSTGASSAANLLFNGTLDLIGPITTQPDGNPGQVNPCPVGWNVDAGKTISGQFFDGGDSEPWCNVSPPSDPTGYGFFFKPFQGSTNANPALNDYLSVQLFQDNSATPGTMFTLSANVACEANCSLILPGTPARALLEVQFLNSAGTIIASNGYDLVANGMPTVGTSGMTQGPNPMTTPQYTAPAGTAAVRAGIFMLNTWGTSGAQSFFADNLDLEATAAPGSPVITSQPATTTIAPGGTVHLSVVATGATTYQWQLAGTNISDGAEYSGTKTATLTITGASVNDVGHYRVLVGNASGSVYSSDAVLALMSMAINPVITLAGKKGDTYRVDYATELAPTNWLPLSTNKLANTTLQVIDPVSGLSGKRFYRAVFLY